jgi:hypothetical protein
MKRSKIFLGVATCFLAIAAIAATKAKSTRTAFVFTALGKCVPVQTLCIYKAGNHPICKTALGSQIYTQKSPVTQKCVNLLTYTKLGI